MSAEALAELLEDDSAGTLGCWAKIFGLDADELAAFLGACLTKENIAAAINAGIVPGGEGGTQTISAELIGWQEISQVWGNTTDHWGTPVPALGAVVNPAGTPGEEIGTLWIDPNLPAGATSFDLTYTILDATGGMGTVVAVEKSTGTQVPGGGYPPGAGGPAQGPVPFDHTVSFTIPAGVDPTDVCVVINAFGVFYEEPNTWGQDEIDPNPETLIVVTPSACAGALECFEAIFGCSLGEMLSADPSSPLSGLDLLTKEDVLTCIIEWSAENPGGLTKEEVQRCIKEFLDENLNLPQAATTIPVPDNEANTDIRTGQVGTSTQFARADHNHPIRRMDYFATPPTPTVGDDGGGTVTVTMTNLGNFEEHVAYRVRMRIQSEAPGADWAWLQLLTQPGYRTFVRDLGNYRSSSDTPQSELVNAGQSNVGAAPRGPLMSGEAKRWGNRVYAPFYRQDNAIANQWIEFDLEYWRA